MFFSGAHAQQVTPSPNHLELYRSRDCAQLKTSGAELEGLFKRSEAQWNQPGLPNLDAEGRAYDQKLRREGLAELDKKKAAAFAALAMAIAEKQCDNPASGAAQSPARGAVVAQQPVSQAAPGAVPPAKQAGAGLLPQIGVRVDAVSPGFAQSLGLTQVRGALVVEVGAGTTADKAGLRALDVIVEITGQQVQSPADLAESLARMRPGFKAALRVWRNKAMRDVVVEIAASVSAAAAAPQPAQVAVVTPASPPPQALLPPSGGTAYCFARINDPPAPTVMSAVFDAPLAAGNVDYAVAKADLIDFQASLQAAGDKRFRPAPPETVLCAAGNCVSFLSGGLFTDAQAAVVICKMDRTVVEELWKRNQPGAEPTSWKPKR
jgi:hypothetical protein